MIKLGDDTIEQSGGEGQWRILSEFKYKTD